MTELPKQEEQRIVKALEDAVKLANAGSTPDEALIKVAEDNQFKPEIVKRMIEAYNVSKTLSHLKTAGEKERGASFPIANPEVILEKLYPTSPETPAKVASQSLHPDYLTDDNSNYRALAKSAEVVIPPMTDKKAEPYEPATNLAAKKAAINHAKLTTLHKQATDAFRTVYFKLLETLDKAAEYWHRADDQEPFDLVEKRAHATFGGIAKIAMDMIYTHGKLDDRRLHVKRASADELDDREMVFDHKVTPYNHVASIVFLAGEMSRLRKEAAEIEKVIDDHAVSNIDLLPPQVIYESINRFLDKEARDMPSFTAQNRPAKVKEIYGALKREHPGMPAGMKARISSRQGKPGKQQQGPPYKGTLAIKESRTLDDMFVKNSDIL